MGEGGVKDTEGKPAEGVSAPIQMDMMTLRQSRSSRGEKWRSDPRYILNMEPGEFPNESTVRCEKKKSEGLKEQSDSELK